MSRRAKIWAINARIKLMAELGGQCKACGSLINLTFDCIKSIGDDHHKGSTDQRMIFYNKEHKKKNIQILCHSCNSQKKAKEDIESEFKFNENPF